VPPDTDRFYVPAGQKRDLLIVEGVYSVKLNKEQEALAELRVLNTMENTTRANKQQMKVQPIHLCRRTGTQQVRNRSTTKKQEIHCIFNTKRTL
jgi:hypothetical protein